MTDTRADQQRIEESLELELIDNGLYRSIQLWKPVHGRGAFGGNIIAQAAHAATKTVDASYHMHSLHCYFLSFGNVDIPVIYQVDHLRSGKSYCTRFVKAIQQGRSIFVLFASFQRQELDQLHSLQTPINLSAFPKPEDCLPTEIKLKRMIEELKREKCTGKVTEYLQREYEQRLASAIEIRNAIPKVQQQQQQQKPDGDGDGDGKRDGQASSMQAFWFRSRVKVKSDPAFQKLVLAYASDFRFLATVAKALKLGARTEPRLAMMASLDHTMWFYDNSVDVSEWMLFTMESPRAESGRGVVIGKIYTLTGKLAVVCTQEGVVRTELPADKAKRLASKL